MKLGRNICHLLSYVMQRGINLKLSHGMEQICTLIDGSFRKARFSGCLDLCFMVLNVY